MMNRFKQFISKYRTHLIVGLLIVLGINLLLDPIVKYYLNYKLDDIDGYYGHVGDVEVHLLATTIEIYDMRLFKSDDDFSKPLTDLPYLSVSLQWKALLDAAFVGEVYVHKPVLNVVVQGPERKVNVDTSLNWVEIVKDIGVVNINEFHVTSGSFNFYDNSTSDEIRLFMDSLYIEATNLAIVTQEEELPSTLDCRGISLGNGQFHLSAQANLLKEVPDMDMALEYENVDLTAFNEAFNRYARVDVEDGELNLYTEVAMKDSVLNGYVKPLLQEMKILSSDDFKPNVVRGLWESLVGLIKEPVTNTKRDQLASKIPIKGRVDDVKENVWKSIGSMIVNAYIRPIEAEFDHTIDFSQVSDND